MIQFHEKPLVDCLRIDLDSDAAFLRIGKRLDLPVVLRLYIGLPTESIVDLNR